MSLAVPTPPLLLTKHLTTFLRSNLSPQIHTALLTTLTGKLLAHASSQSVSKLRTQSTVAASIWTIYSSPTTSDAISQSLPTQPTASGAEGKKHAANAVTVQLRGAILVVRKLKCGLLFVCLGPPPEGASRPTTAQTLPEQSATGTRTGAGEAHHHHATTTPPVAGSPPESVASAGAATMNSVATAGSTMSGSIGMMRRQAEELARWLDDKLGMLGVPEEGAGMEMW